jgi:CcmD family protein
MKNLLLSNLFKKLASLLLLTFVYTNLSAQQPVSDVEMADAMRSNGMIYVVVAVAAIAMIGLLVYVFATDRKIARIEKELKDK